MTGRHDRSDLPQAPGDRATDVDPVLVALARLLGRQAARAAFREQEKQSDAPTQD